MKKQKANYEYVSHYLPGFCPKCGAKQTIGLDEQSKKINQLMFEAGQHFRCCIGKCEARFIGFKAMVYHPRLAVFVRKAVKCKVRKKLPAYPDFTNPNIGRAVDELKRRKITKPHFTMD